MNNSFSFLFIGKDGSVADLSVEVYVRETEVSRRLKLKPGVECKLTITDNAVEIDYAEKLLSWPYT